MTKAVAVIQGIEEAAPGRKLVRATLGGTFTHADLPLAERWTEGLNNLVREAAGEHTHSIAILLDISTLETYNDPVIITLLADLMKKDQLYVSRTASFGGKEIHEIVEQVIEGMVGRDNLRNFKTEAEALAWLAE